jgi:hypothetical protein
MLDFKAFQDGTILFSKLIDGLTKDDLADLTNEMIDWQLDQISDCVDQDVYFEPADPDAYDPHASEPEDVALAWNLGHVIAHVTASSEESAFLAAEMARGIPNHGRSRHEIHWQSMRTVSGCRQRLQESRRIRLASLELWPDSPFLEIIHRPYKTAPDVNAIGQFVLGLLHDYDHQDQIKDIVDQAITSRT